ncbi:MAG: polyprenyl synthetase family protein [Pyrinomonadaceae bacterium]
MLKDFFSQCTRLVDERLDRLVPSETAEPVRLHRAVRWSLFAGGKRFRPALLMAVGKTFGAETGRLLNAAAAIEMIHTYSLIHDDLPAMDDDDLRRGRMTCHLKFDEATAILAGDVLQTLAFQAIAEDENLEPETRVRLVSTIARASGTPTGMVAGQQLDLEAEGGGSISIEEIKKIHQSKTGALISASAISGALIAGAGESEMKAVADYAAQLGLLFQITDDLLDVTQTTEILGKTAGKDVSAEKATYPALYGPEETRRLAERVYRQSCRELETIDRETALLDEIADFILRREK